MLLIKGLEFVGFPLRTFIDLLEERGTRETAGSRFVSWVIDLMPWKAAICIIKDLFSLIDCRMNLVRILSLGDTVTFSGLVVCTVPPTVQKHAYLRNKKKLLTAFDVIYVSHHRCDLTSVKHNVKNSKRNPELIFLVKDAPA